MKMPPGEARCYTTLIDMTSVATRQLDVYLAQLFGWWDIITSQNKNKKFDFIKWRKKNP